jgi:hypothetical protein
MARRKRLEDLICPRIVSDRVVAKYIKKSLTWFIDHRHELEAQGFPKRVLGGNDLEKIDEWIDQQHETNKGGSTSIEDDELWQRATKKWGSSARVIS